MDNEPARGFARLVKTSLARRGGHPWSMEYQPYYTAGFTNFIIANYGDMKNSQLFLYSCLAIIFGIALRSFLVISYFHIFIILIFGAVVLSFTIKNKKWRVLGLVVVFCALGLLRYNLSIPKVDKSDIQYYNDGDKVTFAGVVVGEPDVRIDNVKLKIEIKKLRNSEINFPISNFLISDNQSATTSDSSIIKGKVLVTTNLYPEYEYGDELEISCKLKTPKKFEDFDYEKYLARYDIYSVCYYPEITLLGHNQGNRVYALILRIKGKLKSIVDQGLSEPQSSIFAAMGLGSRQGISEELRDKFSKVGVSHIIAISGLHITLISIILMSVLIRLGLWGKQAFWVATLFLVLYIIMIGAPASAVRAGIMGFLVLLALSLGRLGKSLNALLLVAALMLLINPKILAADVGFQLSFLAVLGIIYFSPWFEKWFKKIPQKFGIRDILVMTFSAQIMVLPLIVYHFDQVSIVAPVANMFILPILPLVMIFGFIATLGGILGVENFQSLLQILFVPTWLLLSYLVKIVDLFSQFSFAGIEVSGVPIWIVGLIYAGIGVVVFRLRFDGGGRRS